MILRKRLGFRRESIYPTTPPKRRETLQVRGHQPEKLRRFARDSARAMANPIAT